MTWEDAGAERGVETERNHTFDTHLNRTGHKYISIFQ